MTISGFSFVRNGVKLYFPVVESIKSILPICDEFVIAVGKGDPDDETRDAIIEIDDPKIKIVDTVWEDFEQDYHGHINAIQTNIALYECSGDWCFYLQADEVVNEKYLPVIKARCGELLSDAEVEGLLFRYKHFWGDYRHFQNGHGWYSREIRIIRNEIGVRSHLSAQSFRIGERKLKVAEVDAEIYHYGWVRPPHLMQNKRKALHTIHWGGKESESKFKSEPAEFDYGPFDRLAVFEGAHPAVMKDKITSMNWMDNLQMTGKPSPAREPHKHEQFKYRALSFIENKFLGGRRIGEYKNYTLLKKLRNRDENKPHRFNL
ncbi:MAG: hypothetical protein HQ591_01610 [candidate division Zixibacteria bacterium]|nr:hypothetical protein [Candidatus Tariuqbacter arcticus]